MDGEESRNIVQGVFLSLWEKQVQTPTPAFLYTLVKNKCIDYLRHKMVTAKFALEYKYKLAALEQFDYTLYYIEDNEEAAEARLQNFLAQLPERCREVFVKSRLDGFTNKEIAAQLQISEKTVENQMTIALRKMREFFQ